MRIRVCDGVVLNAFGLLNQDVKVVNEPTNHVMVIDCSGSMSWELPKIRQQLKNKLPNLVKQGDTVSLVWFSGRSQFGMLAEKVKVNDPTDLDRLNTAIDRWLKPVGLTGFVEPLRKVLEMVVDRKVYSLFFLTDGYDNQWSKDEILKATADLKEYMSGAVFVEYGWCCNRALMTEMAEELGGNLIFCENFDKYEPIISSVLSKSFKSSKKIEVTVGKPIDGLVWSVSDGAPCTYKVKNGKVSIPEGVGCIYYYTEDFNPKDIGLSSVDNERDLAPIYQSLIVLSQRMKSKMIRKILTSLGDVKLFNAYANCFGKQNNTDFQAMAYDASQGNMFEEGRKYNLKINETQFTILDLLEALSNDETNLFVPSQLNYKKMSRATEDASDTLTEAEQKEVDEMTAKAKTKVDLKKIQAHIKKIQKSRLSGLEFEYEDEDAGYPISNLVWNEERPNVSLQVRCNGTVELPKSCKYVKDGTLPKNFPTFIFRNYNIIRDGIANIDELPVKLSKITFMALKSVGLVAGDWDADTVYMINIRKLPTINQSMIREVSAKKLFKLEYDLMTCKASQKVYKAIKEQWVGKRESKGFNELYGEEVATFLKDSGITDYSGFNPRKAQAESTDFYMGIELVSSIKGLGSLPSFNEFFKKVQAKKSLTPREELLMASYKDCLAHENDSDREEWINKVQKSIISITRGLILEMAKLKFSVVVGQVWFKEFASLEENTLTMNLGGSDVECKVEMKDVEIKI